MKKISILLCLMLLFSCVRAEKDSVTKLTLTIPEHFNIQSQTNAITPRKLNPNGTITPGGLNDLNCYALLISGPEDALKKNTCSYKSTSAPFLVGYYEGGFSTTSGSATTLNIVVPSGKERAIRLIGFKVVLPANGSPSIAEICKNFKANESYQNYVSDPYILNESTGLYMPAGGEKTIDMQATFAATNQVGDCKGPDFGGFGDSSGGAPAKFGVLLQDGVGTATAPLRPNSCVGLKLQLQSANGGRADFSSSPSATIKAKIKTVVNGVQVGNFYSPGLLKNCDVGDLLNPTSADFTVSFNQAGNGPLFSDFVLFFAPFQPFGAGTNGLLQIDDGGSASPLPSTTAPFIYNQTTGTPTKYAVYDLFNNESTISSPTPASRHFVRMNECRPAAMQFLDQTKVPMKITTASGPYYPIGIDASPSAIMEFYANSSDCSTATNASGDKTFAISAGAVYGSLNFFYKILSSQPDFTFLVYNVPFTGSPLVPSGDISIGESFWGTSN